MEDVKDGEYHVDVGIPKGLRPTGELQVLYTTHAYKEACEDSKINPILYPSMIVPLPDTINFDTLNIRTLTVKDGKVVKIVGRIPINRVHDLSLVIDPTRGTVITVWVNQWDDYHHTVDASRYVHPEA